MVKTIFAACGPPHSGKSVLLRALYRIGGFYIVPVQPDGEGFGWTTFADAELTRKIRVKGDFNNSQVWNAYISHAKNLRKNLHLLQEIPLLDMGGKPDFDKIQILEKSKASVILVIREDKFDEARTEWEKIASEAGVSIKAIIKTTLYGDSTIHRISPVFEATISGLVRGYDEAVAKNSVVRVLADFLKNLAIIPSQKHSNINDFTLIKIEAIESLLGIPIDPEHLGGRKWWQPGHLPRLFTLAYKIAQNHLGEKIKISGPAPNFVIVTLLHALHGVKNIYLEDPKVPSGVVKMHNLPTNHLSEGPFKLISYDKFDLLYINPEAEVLDVSKSKQWILPRLKRPVVLWGRAPLWAYAIISESLAHIVPWIGVGQPHLYNNFPGFTISVTHETTMPIGSTFSLKI